MKYDLRIQSSINSRMKKLLDTPQKTHNWISKLLRKILRKK